MTRKTIYLVILSFLVLMGCRVKQAKNISQEMLKYDYTQAWKKVEELEKQALPKTVFKKVLEIHKNALEEGASQQLIKSLIYQGKYYVFVEEDGMIKTIDAFENSLNQINQPGKSIVQSMLAELYDTYLTQNLWKIGNRVDNDNTNETDIRNWTAKQFVDKSTNLYLASISYEGLDKHAVSEFDDLLSKVNKDENYRNSLFDILGHRAIDYFREGTPFLVQPPDRYILNDDQLFSSTNSFASLDLSKQRSSRELNVLLLFQKLLVNKLKENNDDATLDLELNRLNYIKNNFIGSNVDRPYRKALIQLKKDFKDSDGIAEVNFYLAELYFNEGNAEMVAKGDKNGLQKAFELCNSTIEKFPGTYGADQCKGLLSRLGNKFLMVKTEQVNLPDEKLIASIEYKNIEKAYFKVVALGRKKYSSWTETQQEEINSFINKLTIIQSFSKKLPGTEDLKQHSVEIALDELESGSYALVVSDNQDFNYKKGNLQVSPFFVSNLAFWHTSVENGHLIYVVDRKSGMPIEDVTIKLYQWNYDRRDRIKTLAYTLKTAKDGSAAFENGGQKRFNFTVELEKGDESLYFENNLYAGSYTSSIQIKQKMLFFTDRSIYRPGQRVYFKGLLIEESNGKEPKIIANRENIKLNLFDANNQKVEELTLSTNQFGSLNGSFTLPETGLKGRFSIGTDISRDKTYFNVEEYKRPKFFVEFEDYESAFKLGDQLQIKGKAESYGGINISNSKVVYRVMRKSYFPYWHPYMRPYPFNQNTVEIANGVSETDASGKFEVPVELLADDQIPQSYRPYFQYEILADVSDLTGETHSAKLFMTAGWSSLDLRIDAREEYHVDSLLKIAVISNNWSGKHQGIKAKIKISSLDAPEKIYRKRFWALPDSWLYSAEEYDRLLPNYSFEDAENPQKWEVIREVQNREIDTGEEKEYAFKLEPGSYKLSLEYRNDQGEISSVDKFIDVYNSSQLPVMKQFMMDVEGGEPGENAQIVFQSASSALPVHFELFEEKERSIFTWKKIGNREVLNHPIEEKHRGNFFVRATYVYNNRFYTETKTVLVPWSNKELEFEYLSFRDKLRPGEKEKWTIKISGKKKDKVLAEMMTTLYDASLDDIKTHQWWANIHRINSLQSSIHYFGFGQSRARSYVDRDWNQYYFPGGSKQYKTINWFGLEHVPGFVVYREDVGVVDSAPPRTMERMMSKRVANGEVDAVTIESDGASAGSGVEEMEEFGGNPPGDEKQDGALNQQSFRSNLNETVFFYPELRTDEAGNVHIEFTMNEALTSWKFLGFAHTKDLMIGLTENKVVTQKELMVRPNPPRFVRVGDSFAFSASISNLVDRELQGQAEIKIYDALSMKEITEQFISGEKEKEFSVGAEGNIAKNWNLFVPDDSPDLLIYRVFVQSGSFTDGEEGYLPVLSNRTLVTETLPMWINGNEKKDFVFKAMDKINDPGLKTHRFTVESTSNPSWYAIQAMPYVREYNRGNSIQLANALYANLLSSEIIEQNPLIERTFTKWKEEAKKGGGSLQSNLQLNEDLKGILLKESPWLFDAIEESAQKRNIALLFDKNMVEQDKLQVIKMLKNLQAYDGGFSWYSGGRSSEYMTLYVLNTLGKLKELSINIDKDYRVQNLVAEALTFCDESIVKRYMKLKKEAVKNAFKMEDDHLSSMDILYLHTRSMFQDTKIADKTREAHVYYLNQATKYYLKKSIYMQGMIALALQANGNSTVAKEIMRSIEEYSIFNEELGRYWKTPNGYHWTSFPLETHALLIEAFHKITKDQKIVQEMQIWLLKNKQSNRWKTAKASIAAIQALLINDSRVLESTAPLQIKVGGKDLKPEGDQAFYESGTGYFQKSWHGEDAALNKSTIELDNPNNHIAWGAAYWQYFQDFDRIKSFEDTPLTITKELFRSTNSKTGEKLLLLNKGDLIQQGEKVIVRLRIEVDRPMDYVRLHDQHGAAMESIEQLSGYRWTGGMYYYLSPGDSGTEFFIEHLQRGVFIIEYPLRAVHSGDYSGGLATIQSMYAPEFSSHSSGSRIVVE